jgi:hypothetical protein
LADLGAEPDGEHVQHLLVGAVRVRPGHVRLDVAGVLLELLHLVAQLGDLRRGVDAALAEQRPDQGAPRQVGHHLDLPRRGGHEAGALAQLGMPDLAGDLGDAVEERGDHLAVLAEHLVAEGDVGDAAGLVEVVDLLAERFQPLEPFEGGTERGDRVRVVALEAALEAGEGVVGVAPGLVVALDVDGDDAALADQLDGGPGALVLEGLEQPAGSIGGGGQPRLTADLVGVVREADALERDPYGERGQGRDHEHRQLVADRHASQ